MAKKWLIVITLALLLLLATPETHACTACPEPMSMAETAEQADLIVTGYKVADGPTTDYGPEWIEVQIVEVLQGTVPENTIIRIQQDYVCYFGIHITDAETYVIFLAQLGGRYGAVSPGCGITKLPVQDDTVTLRNDEQISLDGFVEMLGPDAARIEVAPETQSSPPWILLTVAGIGGCLVILVLVAVGAVATFMWKRNQQQHDDNRGGKV